MRITGESKVRGYERSSTAGTVDKRAEPLPPAAARERSSGSTVVVSCVAVLIFGVVLALVLQPYWPRLKAWVRVQYANRPRPVVRSFLSRAEGYEDATFNI